MTAGEWTTVASAAVVLMAVIAGGWHLSAQITRLETRITLLGAKVEGLAQQIDDDLAEIRGILSAPRPD